MRGGTLFFSRAAASEWESPKGKLTQIYYYNILCGSSTYTVFVLRPPPADTVIYYTDGNYIQTHSADYKLDAFRVYILYYIYLYMYVYK